MATIEIPEEKILDMDEGVRLFIREQIQKAFTDEKSERGIAENLRLKLEEKEEGKWNVVIGKDFGSHVVHKSRRYGLFQVGEISILIWQSGSNM